MGIELSDSKFSSFKVKPGSHQIHRLHQPRVHQKVVPDVQRFDRPLQLAGENPSAQAPVSAVPVVAVVVQRVPPRVLFKLVQAHRQGLPAVRVHEAALDGGNLADDDVDDVIFPRDAPARERGRRGAVVVAGAEARVLQVHPPHAHLRPPLAESPPQEIPDRVQLHAVVEEGRVGVVGGDGLRVDLVGEHGAGLVFGVGGYPVHAEDVGLPLGGVGVAGGAEGAHDRLVIPALPPHPFQLVPVRFFKVVLQKAFRS